MIFLPIIHCCIDPGNDPTYIPNYMCLLCTVDLSPIMISLHHLDTNGNPSFDNIHNLFNAIMVLFHFLYSATPQGETHVIS